MDDLKNAFSKLSIERWIKLFNDNECILLDKYNRKDYFEQVATVELDKDVNKDGIKKRNTLIKFIPTIKKEDFNAKCEWIYLFTINRRIVKIGGTRTGLKGRVGSYLCGHHIKERGKSGDCSKTNGFIYNTFEFYLNKGNQIKMYGYKLPKTELSINIFDNEIKISCQTFHAYETTFLEDYKKKYNSYPILNDNCDPNYKLS